jgi:hypothetical protein
MYYWSANTQETELVHLGESVTFEITNMGPNTVRVRDQAEDPIISVPVGSTGQFQGRRLRLICDEGSATGAYRYSKSAAEDSDLDGKTTEGSEDFAIELTDEQQRLVGGDYKWIIFRASLNRRCWREAPFNKAYMNWAARGWAHLGKTQTDPTGPAYTCEWIKLRYNYGNKDCASSSSCNHTTGKLRHCHGGTLNAIFKDQWGREKTVTVSV